ncbi:MAG: hypothetical protein CME36_01670 [unclassified Hahellaceae]|nr:hypothetical protein [Hahellaceae bacterium]|tara:strand:- start:39493 stop:39906 length:414 start_codon:yes stop_codon:yes gene_type:complete
MSELLLRHQFSVLLVISIVAIVAIGFSILTLAYLVRVRRDTQRLTERVDAQQAKLQILAEGERGVGRRVVMLSQRLQKSEQTQQSAHYPASDAQFDLAEAEKLVNAGATVADLVRTCQLSPADAELLIALRRTERRI